MTITVTAAGPSVAAPAGENTALVAADPERYFIPAYIGPRGWVGYDVDLGHEDWGEVRELIVESYRLAAPKRLAAALGVSEYQAGVSEYQAGVSESPRRPRRRAGSRAR